MKKFITLTIIAALGASVAFGAPEDTEKKQEQFTALLKKVQTSPGQTSEKEIRSLLDLGRSLGRSYTTSLALRGYFTRNFQPSPSLLREAAEIAALSADFRTAAARYKAYLAMAGKDGGVNGDSKEVVSRSAGRLYHILVDFLDSEDDAYQFIAKNGTRFRSTQAARKFDLWFLRTARRNEDWPAMANYLVDVLQDRMPIEKERLHYWALLDDLADELSKANKEHYNALSAARKIGGLIRDSKDRSARWKLIAENLAFHAGSAGKEEQLLDRQFGSVTAAAREYLKDAPSADTLKDICRIFGGGSDRFDHDNWKRQESLKEAFFVQAFARLKDQDKVEIARWWQADHLATGMQWNRLLLDNAKVFKSRNLWRLPLNTKLDGLGEYRELAAVLENTASRDAAVIKAVAVGGKDWKKAVDHFMTRETWAFDHNDLRWVVEKNLIPALRSIVDENKEDDKNPLPDGKVWVYLGEKHLATAPAAYYAEDAAKQYFEHVWKYSGKDKDDHSQVARHVKALAWVPWSERDRNEVYNQLQRDYRNWANWIRREYSRGDKKDEKMPEATRKLLTSLDGLLRKTKDIKTGDPDQAPNKLCKQFTLLIQADNQRDRPAYVKAGQAVYKEMKDYRRLPLGRWTLRTLLTRRRNFSAIDLQAHVLENLLSDYSRDERQGDLEYLVDYLIDDEYRWNWNNIDSKYRDDAKRIAGILDEALLKLAKKGEFWSKIFGQFRTIRNGRGWDDRETGNELMETIIEKNLLSKAGYDGFEGVRSPVVGEMWLVRREFPQLAKKYSPETWFVDRYLAEAKELGFYDYAYWQYGSDKDGKIIQAAAKEFQDHKTMPLGWDDNQRKLYPRDEYYDWCRRLANHKTVGPKFTEALTRYYGDGRWDIYAMGWAYFQQPKNIATDAGRDEFFKQLRSVTARLEAAPSRPYVPYMGELEKIEKGSDLTEEEVDALLEIFPTATPGYWSRGWYYERMARLLHDAMIAQNRDTELYELLPHLWKIGRDVNDDGYMRHLADQAREFVGNERYDLALVTSTCGIELAKGRMPDDARSTLVAVRSSAVAKIGAVIPVDRSDPRYPLFVSQASYLVGKEETAWETYLKNEDRLMRSFKDLDPQFCFWLIEKNIEARRFESAETLAEAMIQWFESASASFEPEIRAALQNAYANISFARGEYPKARASYSHVASAREFEGTQAQMQAMLRVAEVDRQTRQYDQALKVLEKLSLRKDKWLRTEAHYQIALTKFDQGEHADAKEALDKVFALAPGHAEARILEGKINLKLKKLEGPTDLQIGPSQNRRYLVPGMPLKVSLEDRNLSVVGKSTQIEIVAWTKSGDRETFLLTPFGESKTKFRGQVATALEPISKGDHVLQLLGGDVVRYDFSESFKKAHKIDRKMTHALRVVTDGELYASSGEILTKEQREQKALEEMIRKRINVQKEKSQVALSTVRMNNQVKPGNEINVRVVDPDRSKTPGKDKIRVRVAAASGDTVTDFVLTETDTHSGVFEGGVPTASGQPIAMASDTQEGKYANFAISKKDYGPWVAQPDNQRPKTFSIDLNDNVKLNKMTVAAGVPGRRIKKFLLQTSLNGQEFTTIGSWPMKFQQWDGSPKVRAVRIDDPRNVPSRLAELDQYIEWGHRAKNRKGADGKVTLPKVSWGWNIAGGLGKKIDLEHRDDPRYYVAKISAAFYQPRRQIRTFRLDHKGKTEGIRYILTLDGESSESRRGRRGQASSFPEVQKKISKGVHRIDIYVIASDNAKPEFELMCDTQEAPFMAPCPAEMFDPTKNEFIARGVKVPSARIQADEDAENFEMTFVKPSIDHPAGTHARVVRLVLLDFETDAPAINKITLTDAAGDTVLPTRQDFLELRKNQQLELVPGDRITVTYEDPTVLSRGKELHEAFLTATYSNARISACFVEYERSRGEARPRYIPMYRFKPGDVVKVFISDPDMDVSHKPDRLKFKARTSLGQPVELEALETEAHSGVFLGTVFPIESGKKPSRKSELTVEKGDDIILTYMDEENTDPGIPWQRTTSIEQTWFRTPELRVYDVTSHPVDEQAAPEDEQEPAAGNGFEEKFPAERILQAVRPEEVDYNTPARAIIGGPVLVEIIYPSAAQSPASTVTIYAQTSAGREVAEVDPNIPFDIRVPGTIELKATPGAVRAGEPGRGYLSVEIGQGPQLLSPLEEGRFAFNIPVELGALPEKSFATQPVEDRPKGEKPSLQVNGDDEIFIGMKYTNPKTKTTHWITQKVTLDADIFFDVMDRRYQNEMEGLYVGQNIYYRVIDPKKDLSDEKDRIQLDIRTRSGQSESLELIETFSHSGIFKGLNKMVYAQESKDPNVNVTGDMLEVVYGDVVSATYRRNEQVEGVTRKVEIFKGSDGEVIPFTKRFKDSTIAVQTQFYIAESYFEQAKRHRQLGQPELAAEGIAKGKKLLEDAIRDYPDSSARSQADYLLANLALEFGNEVADAIKRTKKAMEEAETPAEKNRYKQQINEMTDERKKHYAEAVTRFADIVSTYPDSEYAPKAQFKKAMTFERMGQIDEASEEYVKLSYRYPEHELVASTIARLGNYFLTKGKMLEKEAKANTDPVEMEKGLMQARKFYKTAGQVLGRLSERFPAHDLAGKASVISGKCYVRGKEFELAVKTFRKVIDNPRKYKNDRVAEAMYWCGDSYMVLENHVEAYRMFKKLTWDYPATMWAKYARGRLTDESLTKVAASEAG
jgi:TolA-binding protein